MGTYSKAILLIVVLMFLITFGVKNSQPVRMEYYFNVTTGQIPLYGVIYLCLFIGILIGMVIGFSKRLRLQKTVKHLEREKESLETEQKETEAPGGTSAPPA